MPEVESAPAVESAATETAVTPASESFDRPAFEESVQEKLDAFNASDDSSAETTESANAETPPAAETDEHTEAAVETEKDEKGTSPAVAQDQSPILPASFRRSLKEAAWSDEEIDSALKGQGNKFLEYATKIHSTRNAETARWADLGRQARQQQSQGQAQTQTQQTSQVLKPVDVAALKKKYGDDGIIDELVAPINSVVESINRVLPIVQQTQANSQRAELDSLGRQIDGFFGSKDMDSYKELYGSQGTNLTKEQNDQRVKVLETADALIGGARLQGRQLTLGEALSYAHDSVSGDFKEQAVQKQMKAKLVQRNKGITLKPNAKKPIPAAKPGDRSSLIKTTEQRLKAAFSS